MVHAIIRISIITAIPAVIAGLVVGSTPRLASLIGSTLITPALLIVSLGMSGSDFGFVSGESVEGWGFFSMLIGMPIGVSVGIAIPLLIYWIRDGRRLTQFFRFDMGKST